MPRFGNSNSPAGVFYNPEGEGGGGVTPDAPQLPEGAVILQPGQTVVDESLVERYKQQLAGYTKKWQTLQELGLADEAMLGKYKEMNELLKQSGMDLDTLTGTLKSITGQIDPMTGDAGQHGGAGMPPQFNPQEFEKSIEQKMAEMLEQREYERMLEGYRKALDETLSSEFADYDEDTRKMLAAMMDGGILGDAYEMFDENNPLHNKAVKPPSVDAVRERAGKLKEFLTSLKTAKDKEVLDKVTNAARSGSPATGQTGGEGPPEGTTSPKGPGDGKTDEELRAELTSMYEAMDEG